MTGRQSNEAKSLSEVMTSTGGRPIEEYDIGTNGITLHVTEVEKVRLSFSATAFRIPPIRGDDRCRRLRRPATAPLLLTCAATDVAQRQRDAALYTPLQTCGDLVGLLDALKIPSAVIVGHDWGASVAWNAALMRPDRFTAVFCLAVPYVPRGDVSFFEYMRKTGHQNDFYMFEQCLPEADQIWADATVTIPGVLYWASGSAPRRPMLEPIASGTEPIPEGARPIAIMG